MYHLAVFQLPVEGIPRKLVSWTQGAFTIQKVDYAEICLWSYWCYKIWQFHV